MEVQWFKRDKEAVLDDLRRGVRPLMATTMSSGPLDELIALHDELGVFDALDQTPGRATARGDRRRSAVPDPRRAAVLARAGPRPSGTAALPGAGHLAPPGMGPRPDPGRRQSAASSPRGEASRVVALSPRHLAGRVPPRRGRGLAPRPAGRGVPPVPASARPGQGLCHRRQRPGQRLSPGLPGLRLGAAASDRGLAAVGRDGFGEGPRGRK